MFLINIAVMTRAKLKPLWKCPKCGARLVSKNLWHSCGQFTLEALFAASEPSVLALAKRYIAMIQSLGDVQVISQKPAWYAWRGFDSPA